MDDKNNNIRGIALVIISTILWAVNGNFASYLFSNKELTPAILTFFRLIISGIVLLFYQYLKNGRDIFLILKNKKELTVMIYFSFFGLLAMQYGYFVAVRYSNAGTATIIQSLAPFIIVIVMSIITRSQPSKTIVYSLILAFAGVFLLVTHGKLTKLNITSGALVFGLLAAFGSVNYNLSPKTLQDKYNTILVVGWAMLISGLGFGLALRPWNDFFIKDPISILGILYVAIFGTLFPFLFYLMGCKIIGPQRAGILTLIEPVAATLIAVMVMGEEFIYLDYISISMVIVALFILSSEKQASKKLTKNLCINNKGED